VIHGRPQFSNRKARELTMKKTNIYPLVSTVSLFVFIGAWELLTDFFKIVPSTIMPSPYTVIVELITKFYDPNPDGATLLVHIFTSLQVSLIGYFFGALIGVPLGIMMAWYKKVDNIVRPIFDMVRPIPPIAWIPIMLLWFGIGLSARAAIIFISAFIPCLINAYSGIECTSTIHVWVAKTFGASNFEVLKKVALPTALPYIFTGLRISLGASWSALVAAELLASNQGLGYMIQISRNFARPDIIVVGMLTIGGIGALLSSILEFIENKYVKGGI
jgi:ABC-type nitrate/sulfonate/bicarbonate transport system permease component